MSEEIKICYIPGGHPVASCSGRQMSSFVNPHKEAVEWVKHYEKSLLGRDCAVILGLGSGYHIGTLAEIFSGRMIVVEKFPKLVDHFRKTFPHLKSRIEFTLLESIDEKKLLSCKLTSYAVLTFAPAIYFSRAEYQKVFNLLAGRSAESLNNQFKLRGVDHYFCPSTLSFDSPSESYRQLAKDQALPLRWKNLFRMMGELIK